MNDSFCLGCKSELTEGAKFCSQCGRSVKKSLSTSLGTQIMIYGISFLLAPFGLAFVFKYLKNGGKKERVVGYIALALTILAVGLVIFLGAAFANYQVKLLQDLGL